MNNKQLIQPRTLPGFRDFLPEAMMPRERIIEIAQNVYRSYGFVPIDSPALEYFEILTGKGSEETDRQMYNFEDNGGRHVGMRFDLTVPLARYVAQHINDLGTPFKRYHIATVWRGERPQAGRYREFMQCDFDTIGTTSIVADIESALVINDLMRSIGFKKFVIQVNNRKVLSGLLQQLGLSDQASEILRVLDKLPKIGAAKVLQEMQSSTGASDEQAGTILKLAELQGDNNQILDSVEQLVGSNELAQQGIDQLRQLNAAAKAAGLSETHLKICVSVARGLDYYTGTVFETFLNDLPSIGSVCSGGRYDNLASLYTKQQLPGIGASLGLDRLLTAMETLEMISPSRTTADLLIVYFDAEHLHDYLKIAAVLRAAGIGVEIYPEAKKIAQQFKYADRRGFPATLVAGANELENSKVHIKWMESGEQVELEMSDQCQAIVSHLQDRLSK